MKNKLDPFAESLDAWKAEGKTLAEIQKQLAADGCKASLSSISEYLSARARERDQEEFFRLVATGGEMNRQLDSAYEKNPEPGIERLMRMIQTQIVTLHVKGAADPKLLSMANSMQQTFLNFLSAQGKAELEKEKLAQSRVRLEVVCCEKFLEWWKDEKAREIADSTSSNAQKIAALRQTYFKDVDALQQSGAVKLPE